MRIDPIELSRELIAFNTINPPGNELTCIRHLEKVLAGAGLDHSRIQEHLKAELGDDISLEPVIDVGAVWTDPSAPWIRDAYGIVRDVTGEDPGSEPRTAPYFTDASALAPAFGNPPTIILGPGDAAKAHQTDEYCSVQRIREAADIYSKLAAKWSGRSE